MTELRRELFVFTADRVWGGIASEMADMDAVEAFFETGKRYISLACDHPNVFRYLCVDESTQAFSKGGQEDRSIFSFQFDPVAVEMLSKQYDVPVEKIGRAVQDTVIYTHGLAVMMMRDNFRMPKEDACGMIYDMGVKMLKDIGISIS